MNRTKGPWQDLSLNERLRGREKVRLEMGLLRLFPEEPGELLSSSPSSTQGPKTPGPILIWEKTWPACSRISNEQGSERRCFFFFVLFVLWVVPLHYPLTVWSWMRPLPSLGLSFPIGCYRPLLWLLHICLLPSLSRDFCFAQPFPQTSVCNFRKLWGPEECVWLMAQNRHGEVAGADGECHAELSPRPRS